MKRILLLVLVGQFILMNNVAFASQKVHSHAVTIHVPKALEVSSPRSRINLTFPHKGNGAETNTVILNYSVKANGMSQADGAAAVTAQLDGMFPHIDFQAEFGSYEKTRGNTELVPASAGFVSIKDNATVLARKSNSSGDGKIAQGNFHIAYKAVAQDELSAGNYDRQLFLTVTDV